MRFYSRKKPQKKTEMLIERISTGKCDDLVVSELKVAASESDDPAEMEGVVTGLLDIALKSGNPVSVAYAIKTLLAFRPLTAGLEDDLENRAREMALNPGFLATKPLQEALAELLYIRVSERAECARPFIGMLVRFLDERTGRVGTVAYNTLMIVAANQPEYFDGQTAPLVRMLGSINKVTRIETSKIIAVLSLSHPEYVADAEKILLHISSFNPDGELKNAASEAHQILSGRLHPDEKRPYDDSARRNRYKEEQSGGLAEIMRSKMGNDKKVTYDSRIDKRLLSLATNFARKADRAYKIDGESQAAYEENETAAMSRVIDDFSEIAESIKAEAGPAEAPATQVAADGGDTPEEAELRLMMEKVQDDFSITAGSILDAIGMGHLAKKAMMDDVKPAHKEVSAPERPKRARRPDLIWTTHVPEKPPVKEVEEEISPKEFIASIESIINDIDNPQPETPQDTAIAPVTPVTAVADIAPAPKEVDLMPVKDVLPPVDIAEKPQVKSPVEVEKPEKQIPAGRTEEQEKRARPPIVPVGVRISAMKFKSVDQSKSKKPAPAKISIKPHIKPLSKPPVDVLKNTVPRQHPATGAPEIKTDGNNQGYVICHSCNTKMPDDSQRCAICGSDLKDPKIRCRKCGEINQRQAGKCTRCGSAMDE
ncbi:MAG: hypothetical protein WBZ29_07650 [Methanocella sp.]